MKRVSFFAALFFYVYGKLGKKFYICGPKVADSVADGKTRRDAGVVELARLESE